MLLTLALFSTALAQGGDQPEPGVLVLTDQQGEYPLGGYVDILEDPGGELTIEDVSSPKYEASFIRSEQDVPVFGFTDNAYWLRFRLRNQNSLTNQWLLETVFPNINYVDLYLPLAEGGFLKKQSGSLRPFNTRDIPYYHVVFRLPLATQEDQTVYLRVQSGSSMTLAFTVWSPESFASEKIKDALIGGLFYGSLLLAFGYHLLLFKSLKDFSYLYFSLFIACSILFFAFYEGIADLFLWPPLSQGKLYLLNISMSLFFISALFFSDYFLEQKTQAPHFHRIFIFLIVFWTIKIPLTIISNYLFLAQLSVIGLILTPLITILSGLYSWRKGFHPAYLYFISWLGFMSGIITVELVRLGLISSTPFTENSYQIGLFWLVLLSSLALADRIKILATQTENANRLLRSSENKLSQTLEGLPLGVAVYGNDHKPQYINRRSIEILANPERGIVPDLAAGRTLAEALDYYSFRISGSDQAYPLEKLPVERALNGEVSSANDIEIDLQDKRVSLEIWANPIKDEQGNVENVVVAFQDISTRKQAEAELDEYRHHLEQLVAKRTTELSTTNNQLNQEVKDRKALEEILHRRIEWLSAVNRVHQRLSGPANLPEAFDDLSATILQLLGVGYVFINLWDGKSEQVEAVYRNQAIEPPRTISYSSRLLQTDHALYADIEQGKLIFLTADQAQALPDLTGEFKHTGDQYSILLAPMKTRNVLIGLLVLGLPEQRNENVSKDEADLIERIALDLANLIEDARLLEKAQALAANEERNRLARDLHDSVTQVLFSASLVAEVLPRIWKRDPATAQKSLVQLKRLTRGALAEMRTLLLELRPSAVVKSPLGELIAQLTEAITSRSGLPFQLFIEQIPVLPEDVHVNIYRIAQECLNNVVKHAQASLVTVGLSATPDRSSTQNEWRGEVKLVIRDNGVGFAIQDDPAGHMGIGIIRERARSINASVIINSQPGDGTELTLTWHN